VGAVLVGDLYDKNHTLKIAKVEISRGFHLAVVLGHGLVYAEDAIKTGDFTRITPGELDIELDLDGMECKWQGIDPIRPKEEVLCLIINVPDVSTQHMVYKEIFQHIEAIYGTSYDRNPVTIDGLTISLSPIRAYKEMLLKFGGWNMTYFFRSYIRTLIGKLVYFQFMDDGKKYKQRITELADTLNIDGRIATVIAGTKVQRDQLRIILDQLEKEGKIRYGEKVSPQSIMSCYVMDLVDRHIHFIDGSDGGYTAAATMLKRKMRENG
jgi:hypothetical protein